MRQAGLQLGLPKEIVYRQPFPGPGLAVRILGEVTPERLRILRDADTIVSKRNESERIGITGSGNLSPCCCRCAASA